MSGSSTPAATPDGSARRPGHVAKRVALASVAALISLNIWTGAPLLALWIGSRAVGGGSLSMGAVAVVVVVLAVFEVGLVLLLTWVNSTYDRITERPHGARRTSPWLRSMRGEREEIAARSHGISPIERLVVLSVVACVIVFEVWFFFFAGSPFSRG